MLAHKKGFIGWVAQSIITQPPPEHRRIINTAAPFEAFKGYRIRNIYIDQEDWRQYKDPSLYKLQNFLIGIGNHLHVSTRKYTIKTYLLFHEGDTIEPYILADNLRIFRSVPFLQNQFFLVAPVHDIDREVDVYIISKDNYSLGADIGISSQNSGEIKVHEDNVAGVGIRFDANMLVDLTRREKVAFSVFYTQRNIAGSFADLLLGYSNYAPAFNTNQTQEMSYYGRIVRPLISPYTHWTYTFNYENHATTNQYVSDSVYKKTIRYQYNTYEAWAGYNIVPNIWRNMNITHKTRSFIALRLFNTFYQKIPDSMILIFRNLYRNQYGVLGSYSLFKESYYSTSYIYDFGRDEDVAQGISGTITGGYINTQGFDRFYLGLDFQRSYFNKQGFYFNILARASTYYTRNNFQDITALVDFNFFTNLIKLSRYWRNKIFINASYTSIGNVVFAPPLLISSTWGLPEFSLLNFNATSRTTIRFQDVFFCQRAIFGFKFAPFVFANTSFLTPETGFISQAVNFTSLGGGVRIRNESLILGTIELRAYYFPQNYPGLNPYRFDFKSNLEWGYNSNFTRKPDIIQVN